MKLFGMFKRAHRPPAQEALQSPAAQIQKAPTPPTFRVGSVIDDRYQIRRLLGQGGFGSVFLVEGVPDGELYALKTLTENPSTRLEEAQGFAREAKAWLDLENHPFIVHLHNTYHVNGRLTVLMEYVPADTEGRVTLHDHIASPHEQHIDDRQIGQWAIEFCHAMEHATTKGLRAHRDIKPQNLLIDSNGFLKVSDFGLAVTAAPRAMENPTVDPTDRASQFLTQDGRGYCGTVGFIAPELAEGKPASCASDMYSFGVTLWQMCARSADLPYRARYQGDLRKFQQQVYEEQRAARWGPLDSIYADVIKRCLNPDPSARYATYKQLREDVRAATKRAGLRVTDFIINAEGLLRFADLVNKGASFSALGDYDKALRFQGRAVELEPDSFAARVNRGNTFSRMGKPHLALADYNIAVTLAPYDELALINRSDCHLELNDLKSALHDIDAVLLRNRSSTRALWRRAFILGPMGRIDDATADIRTAVLLEPASAKLRQKWGEFLVRTRRWRDAVLHFDEAISRDHLLLSAYLGKIEALLRADLRSDAFAAVKVAMAVFGHDAASLNMIGVSLSVGGAPRQAIEVFKATLEIDPSESAVVHLNIGNALIELENDEAALESFERSIAADASCHKPHLRAADVHYRLGRLSEAAAGYETAGRLEPNAYSAWFGAGSARMRLSDLQLAVQHLQRAVALEPGNALGWYNLGAAYAMQGQFEEAQRSLAAALERKPDYAKAWMTKSQIERHLGDDESAWRSCIQADRHKAALTQAESQTVQLLLKELSAARGS
jgi:serine/threonine protein kinase/Tfp pilus assembly protein PilF